nr:MAG TPA: hypothetical protein [Caudoviricetes sp.]
MQRSTLTLYIDHMLDKSRVNVQRLFPMRELGISKWIIK